MNIVRIHQYQVVSKPTKAIVLLEDEDGWWYIKKDPSTIFSSVQEIEIVLDEKLSWYSTLDVESRAVSYRANSLRTE